jgi:hypothetical protein
VKIKEKKAFGEKHRLRCEERERKYQARHKHLLDEQNKSLEKMRMSLEESKKRHQEFLVSQLWYQRIKALRPGDPCEFYKRPNWHAGLLVQHPVDSEEGKPLRRWKLRDSEGSPLRVLYVRAPADEEAWPGLGLEGPSRAKQRMIKLGMQPPEDVEPDLDVEASVAMSRQELS